LTWSDTGQLITETFDAQGLATTPLTHLTTGGAEQNPAHAAQADGYALAWADFSNPGGAQIFFAGFDANGEEIGTPVDITADLPPIYVGFLNPKMAALSDGNYALVWTGSISGSSQLETFTAVYDGHGNQVVAPVGVTDGGTGFPQITALADGNYAVAWEGGDGEIYTAVSTAQGQQISAPIDVSHAAAGDPSEVEVVTLSTGDYAIAWQNGSGGISTAICNAQGQETAGPVVVDADPNDGFSGDTQQVTALANGAYVITWENAAPTMDFPEVHSAIYQDTSTGTLSVIKPATRTADSDLGTTGALTTLSNGDFVIAYQVFSTDDGVDYSTSQVFDAQGNLVGTNSTPTFVTAVLDAAGLVGGGYAFAFDGVGPDTGDAIDVATYDASGRLVSGPTLLDAGGFHNMPNPGVAVTPLADGGYAVSWFDQVTSDVNHSDLFTATFNAQGAETTGPTDVSNVPAGSTASFGPFAHAAQANGGYALGWTDTVVSTPTADVYFAEFDSAGQEIGAPIDVSAGIVGTNTQL